MKVSDIITYIMKIMGFDFKKDSFELRVWEVNKKALKVKDGWWESRLVYKSYKISRTKIPTTNFPNIEIWY